MLLQILTKWKYPLLLLALIQHLFLGVFLPDLVMYSRAIWIVNMLIVGLASVGVFIEKGRWKIVIRNVLFMLVLILPIGMSFFGNIPFYFPLMNIAYVVFFLFIFLEILRFLLKPSYVNADIILASACGYFLLIEVNVFLMQFCIHQNPDSFRGIGLGSFADTYMDLVYFCSITITSIGFGDIVPNTHHTRLITALFGIMGQFYSVVLLGILISKFTSRSNSI